MPTWETVLLEYQNKAEALHASLLQTQAAQTRFAVLTAGLIALLVIGMVGFTWREATSWIPPLLLTCAAAWSGRRFSRFRQESFKLSRLRRMYESGVDRLNGHWAGKGATGDEFSRDRHLYERDLNILGQASMFELLCTARTGLGKRRLAGYLLDLPERDETLARQDAVRELASRQDLREKSCLLGSYSSQDSEWEPFHRWQEARPVEASRWLPWIMLVNSCAIIPMIVIPWAAGPGNGLWAVVAPFLALAVVLQAAFGFALRGRIQPALEGLRAIGHEAELFRRGLELLEAQQFRSAKLTGLVESVKGASGAVRRLERIIRAVAECNKEWFYGPSRLLLLHAQLALAGERWKVRHSRELTVWLEAWAEFEALNSLGGYAHEHPEDVFPEIAENATAFEASALGHPLLPEGACVRNDVELDGDRRFYLVSGSNMAGKSTFLRTMGVNAVLASAGAPVRAERARISSFAVCASFSVADSLAEGKSKFMAEVERLRETLLLTGGGKPVLFAIDEILSGTNSRDRRVAAESFVRALIAGGAVGALSTHDLALAEIADDPALRGSNVHMESSDPADPFAFDYVLKPGVSTHSNALAIARLAGVAL